MSRKRDPNSSGRQSDFQKSVESAGLRLDRIELARQRVAQGFYNSSAVKKLVVERLLADPEFLKRS